MARTPLERPVAGVPDVSVVDHPVARAGGQHVRVPCKGADPLCVRLLVGALQLERVGVVDM